MNDIEPKTRGVARTAYLPRSAEGNLIRPFSTIARTSTPGRYPAEFFSRISNPSLLVDPEELPPP